MAPDSGEIRRTALAGERTELAWWRTGLTALAVAVGVGRVVPELQADGAKWPYVVLGVAFGAYAFALFLRGTQRGRAEAEALGEPPPTGSPSDLALIAAGPLLAVAVIVLVILQ